MKSIYEEILSNIPDYKRFLTLEELDESSSRLAKNYPDIASVFVMGKTKEGKDLLCLKIGDYDKNALMFGCPHPNEPIGTMMLEYLTESLCKNKALRDELGFTWYIVKAWDADGYKLNEKWLKGPYTLYNYARNFFRPAGHVQVDWTFPIKYKGLDFNAPVPEASAMMALIDKIQPKFIYSLHNGGFCGAYWYISHDMPHLYDGFREGAKKVGVPLNLGEPEAPYCELLSPAVYKETSIKAAYDYLEQYGVEDPAAALGVGDNSGAYALEKYDSLTLLTELPYFYDDRIDDTAQGTMLRKEAVKKGITEGMERNKFLREFIKGISAYIKPDNCFKVTLDSFTKDENDDATLKMIEENPEYNRMATVCEEFDSLQISKFYDSLNYGMLVRMIETEIEAMDESGEADQKKRNALQAAFYTASKQLKELTDQMEKDMDYSVVPIWKLVYIQLNAGLMVADAIARKND